MVWSADDDEQAGLAGTVLSGELRGARATLDGGTSPQVGVHLNLTTAGKVGFYLDASHAVEDVTVRPDGSQEFTVRLKLRNVLAPEGARDLPAYVVGDGPKDGSIESNVLLYAPQHGAVRTLTDGAGDPLGIFAQEHAGLPVAVHTVSVAPGETQELVFRVLSGREQRGNIQVRMTPGARVIG
jgi:hypothetical protein